MNLLKNKQNTSGGFTLIELLVVISIIGLLASIVLVNVNSTQKRARDVLRKADLKQIQSALEIYYSTNGAYPSTADPGNPNVAVWYSSEPSDPAGLNGPNNNGDWIPGLTPEFMSKLPKDPKGGDSSISYCSDGVQTDKSAFLYISNGLNYKLLANCSFENSSDSYNYSSDTYFDPVRTSWAWMITNKNDLPVSGSCLTPEGVNYYDYPSTYPICW